MNKILAVVLALFLFACGGRLEPLESEPAPAPVAVPVEVPCAPAPEDAGHLPDAAPPAHASDCLNFTEPPATVECTATADHPGGCSVSDAGEFVCCGCVYR